MIRAFNKMYDMEKITHWSKITKPGSVKKYDKEKKQFNIFRKLRYVIEEREIEIEDDPNEITTFLLDTCSSFAT